MTVDVDQILQRPADLHVSLLRLLTRLVENICGLNRGIAGLVVPEHYMEFELFTFCSWPIGTHVLQIVRYKVHGGNATVIISPRC